MLPLRLDRLFFSEQSVSANPDHNPAEPALVQTAIAVNAITQGEVIEIRASVALDEAASSNATYRFRLVVHGHFLKEPGADDEAIGKFVSISAIQIVVGAARERLLDLTARGPLPPVTLALAPFAPTPERSPA